MHFRGINWIILGLAVNSWSDKPNRQYRPPHFAIYVSMDGPAMRNYWLELFNDFAIHFNLICWISINRTERTIKNTVPIRLIDS